MSSKTTFLSKYLLAFMLFAGFCLQTTFGQTEKCLNMAISEVKMLDLCTKNAVFEITIVNTGLRPIDLPDAKTLGIQYFWSGNALYDSGDIFIGGTLIHDFGDYGKSLSPDGTYTIKVKVPLAKKSRYQNYLVFIADALFLYDECDELDNIKGVAVK
jgi:hypothetical protein